jgi:thioredoxin 1
MPASGGYSPEAPERSEIEKWQGAAVLEFGTDWCGICGAAQPLIRDGLAGSAIKHVKVEDGRGRPLGRSFHVKLWPTLIFLRDGKEVARVVRPGSTQEISQALARLH